MKHVKTLDGFLSESQEIEITEQNSSEETVNESVYPKDKGGPIENTLRSEEVGRLNLKHKGEIIGTLLVWMRPSYVFGGGASRYDESRWEYGASYTSYPLYQRTGGSTGSGVWSSSEAVSKEEALKACKDFLKNTKLS
jgi:hypothetical protein